MNDTSPQELRLLAAEVFELSHSPHEDESLERRAAFASNPMMDGDSSWTFTRTHKGALRFISQLLGLRADELDRLRPTYCLASGMEAAAAGETSTEIEGSTEGDSPTAESRDAQ